MGESSYDGSFHLTSSALNHGCSIISTICLAMLSTTWLNALMLVWPTSGTKLSVSETMVGIRAASTSVGGLCVQSSETVIVAFNSRAKLVGASTTNASASSWTATFSEPVTGVDPTDFSLIETGTVGATLTQVTGSGSVYTVTVSGITGNGTLGMNLGDNDSIKNAANSVLGGAGANNGNFTGQVETLDHVSPLAVPVMLEIGREAVYGEASEALLAEAEAELVKEAMQ